MQPFLSHYQAVVCLCLGNVFVGEIIHLYGTGGKQSRSGEAVPRKQQWLHLCPRSKVFAQRCAQLQEIRSEWTLAKLHVFTTWTGHPVSPHFNNP